MTRRGLLFVLSSPSGAGKSTLSRMLLAADEALRPSVSATTRPPRAGEVDGKDYHFTSLARFEDMVAAGDFLEWAHVFGHCYGTPRAPVEELLAAGRDVLFDIDWQGAQQLRHAAGADVARLFILPPSIAELEHRLRARGTDADDVIAARMERARAEISHWSEYDYVLINADVDICFLEIQTILHAERLRLSRQTGMSEFTRGLMAER